MEQREKEKKLRAKLRVQRSVLVVNGRLTESLVDIFRIIFLSYATSATQLGQNSSQVTGIQEFKCKDVALDFMAASRLWYICKLRLSLLSELVEYESSSRTYASTLTLEDFLTLMGHIAVEDEVFQTKNDKSVETESDIACEVRPSHVSVQ
jgi:hypothetical protein